MSSKKRTTTNLNNLNSNPFVTPVSAKRQQPLPTTHIQLPLVDPEQLSSVKLSYLHCIFPTLKDQLESKQHNLPTGKHKMLVFCFVNLILQKI